MKEFRLNGGLQEDLLKVIVNDDGDAIYINPNDGTFIDRFGKFLGWLDIKTKELEKIGEEKSKQYDGREIFTQDEEGETVVDIDQLLELTDIQTGALREISAEIDSLFGQDTLRKYFKVFYEINPDFIPDAECINDFLEQIIPAVNQAYNTRIERINKKYSRDRRQKQRTKAELIEEGKRRAGKK